jgi:16S rRNA (uracil1498-N3)-methyltransferase
MRLHRFYVTQPLGEEVVIVDVSVLKQWVKVFRYQEGDFVILFNGDGNDYRYSFVNLTHKECTLTCVGSDPSYIPKRKTYLYLSLIKKDAFEYVVQKATELGVTDIVPILGEHTEKRNIDLVRLGRIIKEAAEQSGRGDLLTLHPLLPFTTIQGDIAQRMIPPERMYAATLRGEPLRNIIRELSETEDIYRTVACMVGPEGGWSEEEETTLKESGFTRISLGETVLRAETAGIVCSFLSSLI